MTSQNTNSGNRWSALLAGMASGSDSQIDKTVCDRLTVMASDPEPKASQLKTILDDIVYASLASGFVVVYLDFIWKDMLAVEKGAKA